MSEVSNDSLHIRLDKPQFVIMCIDDDPNVLEAILNDIHNEFHPRYDVVGAGSAKEARDMIEILEENKKEVALFIVDQRMPETDGVSFLAEMRQRFPYARRVILTAYSDKENTIQAINKAGVHNYFVKPWEDFKYLIYLDINRLLLKYSDACIERITLHAARESVKNIFRIALMSESGRHAVRVAIYAHQIGARLGMGEQQLTELCEQAFVHDIGLIGIDLIYKDNPPRLEDEYMKPDEHQLRGEQLIGNNPYFQNYMDTIKNHHEWYSVWSKREMQTESPTIYRRIITVADTIDCKALRPDVLLHEVPDIITTLSRQKENLKFDPSIMNGFHFPTADLSHPFWEESKRFVTGLTESRGYLKLDNYELI